MFNQEMPFCEFVSKKNLFMSKGYIAAIKQYLNACSEEQIKLLFPIKSMFMDFETRKYSMSFLEEYVKTHLKIYPHWELILQTQELTEAFIEKNVSENELSIVCEFQALSIEFIAQMLDNKRLDEFCIENLLINPKINQEHLTSILSI